jgi:hypothetical protein
MRARTIERSKPEGRRGWFASRDAMNDRAPTAQRVGGGIRSFRPARRPSDSSHAFMAYNLACGTPK